MLNYSTACYIVEINSALQSLLEKLEVANLCWRGSVIKTGTGTDYYEISVKFRAELAVQVEELFAPYV